MPKISVIMLAYNRVSFVDRAIQSILDQTFKDFEFIIVDNGSTDLSGVIADEYAVRDDRVRVIHRERGNIGSGRNSGIDAAKGEYITFIDDDDFVEPDFLQFLYDLAEKYHADIAISGSWRKLEDGVIEPKYIFEEILLQGPQEGFEEIIFRKHYNSGMPTKMIKTELFKEIRFPEQGIYDDINTTYKYLTNAGKILSYGKPKYTCCRHGKNNSISATSHQNLNPVQLEEYLTAFKKRTEYVGGLFPELVDLAQWSELSYMISMTEKVNRYHLKNCAVQLQFMVKELKKNRCRFIEAQWTQDFERQWLEEYVR